MPCYLILRCYRSSELTSHTSQNGTFVYTPPDACSPVDSGSHSCARGDDNDTGFYESSSYEYSFWAPHSMSSIVKFMGGAEGFVTRL